MSDVRVRFAPSPTGYLHVGGARTAIFNWLFARSIGGTFLLRIEDTDPVRSRGELAQVILDGLKWLGIESDEAVVYQSDRHARFIEVARDLVKRGHAYYDFTTPEELEEMRRKSQAAKEPSFRFRADRSRLGEGAEARMARGEPYAIRFIAPLESSLEWNDLVHGPIRIAGSEVEDFVLLRSDGTPTYHLSVVCDDADMRISHVLRGDDHISNTPKQLCIYRAMEWAEPQFGHVPLILGPDKQRLSKRAGATSVGEFQERGFLPQAMFNFLTLLGWSPGAGDQEIFSREDLTQAFTLAGIQAKSAVFDIAKLEWMNGEHLRLLTDHEAADYLAAHDQEQLATRDKLQTLMPLVKTRIRLPEDLFTGQRYYFLDPESYDEAGVAKHFVDPQLKEWMLIYRSDVAQLVLFVASELEARLRARSEEWGMSAGKLIHPLRLALTGKTVSAGLFEVMEVLGRETVLRRIDRAVAMLTKTC